MIIDFHAHIFNDSLASKGLSVLMKNLKSTNVSISPSTDMTLGGLLKSMEECNIDLSVVQPIITKETQTITVNNWAKSIASDKVISFGGIYPHSENYKEDIQLVAGLGIKGLKFHPEYQNFEVDDPKMIKIYDYAISCGLMLLFHGGVDIGMPAPYKSNPMRFANVIDELKGGTIIIAHLGGYMQWDDVEAHLVGKNVYLDTSMGFGYYSKEQFVRIVKNHGSEKILFASDSPWSNPAHEIACIKGLPLTQAQKDNILGLNAKRLLGIA